MFGLQVVAVLLVVGPGMFASACDTNALMTCVTQMTSKATALSTEGFGGGIPTATEIETACDLFDDFRGCYEPIIGNCQGDSMRQMMLGFNVIRGMTDYMCGEGKQDLIDNAACFEKQTVKDGMMTCTDEQKGKQAQLTRKQQAGEISGQEMIDATCGMMSSSKTCITNAISAICPGTAGSVAAEFLDRSFQPVKEMMNCPAAGTAAVTAGLTSTILAVLMSLVMMYAALQ